MQSILMPRLAGQIYAMAGMRTQLNFAGRRARRFFGENAQFNGVGFQNEKFAVDAMDAAGFARWLAEVRAQPNRLDAAEYETLTRRARCRSRSPSARCEPGLFDQVVACSSRAATRWSWHKLPPHPCRWRWKAHRTITEDP